MYLWLVGLPCGLGVPVFIEFCYFFIHVEFTLTTFDGAAYMLVEGVAVAGDPFFIRVPKFGEGLEG